MPAPKYFVKKQTLRQYCDANNILYTTIINRIHDWYTLKQALAKPMNNTESLCLVWEERVEIRRYKWYYDVSNYWRVRTYRKWIKWWSKLQKNPVRILKWRAKKQTTTYNCHTLYKTTDRKRHFKTARLVAQAFLNLRYNDDHILVCHKDDDGMNNHVDNLFLWSHKDNTQDSIRKGRCKLKYCVS